jgi:tetraacyldisaccharide 4'-kinase
MAARLAEQWQEQIMGQEKAQHHAVSALRGLAWGGARLYERGLDVYLDLERLGIRRRDRLPIPIVSVGNLTVGGTGKTPMTQLLCRRLSEKGKRVAVLSRGHGGKGSGVRLVSDAHGNIARGADDAGDEPYLLASSLPGIPVLVGKDRRDSGREAMRRFALDALVLDDGFQFWQLVRDLDIVLVDARNPFDNGQCLPRGLLREPPRHLKRADIVVATRSDEMEESQRMGLRRQLESLAPDKPLFFARHRPDAFVKLGEDISVPLPLDHLAGKKVIAWSAVARPDSFVQSLVESTGVLILSHIAEPDHYSPTEADVRRVEALARDQEAQAVIMTEKDAVKWPSNAPFPAYALRVQMHVDEEELFLEAVIHSLFKGSSL